MGKINEIIQKILNLMLLSIYWLVSCLPVVTIGAATAALYYTTQKVIKNDRGYVSGEYWRAFKENFKNATLCWLVHGLLGFLFADEGYLCYQMWTDGEPIGWLWIVFVLLEVINLAMALVTFPYLARFDDGPGRALKNSCLILLTHLPKGLLLLLLAALFVVGVVYFVPMLLLAPAGYMLLCSFFLEKIFRNYMSPEDQKAEQERNRIYR